ncbi:MAG: hypothetical protein ACQGVC_11605 [Myxococcota bacterium]
MAGDERLRAHFDALRARDARCAPDLDAALRAARSHARPHPRWRLGAALAAATAAAAAVLWFGPAPQPRDGSADLHALGRWRTPSDALLATPGRGLLESPDWGSAGWGAGGVPSVPDGGPRSHFHGRSHG